MIPVFQTKFGGSKSSKEEKGDCMAACIASILELSLEDINIDLHGPYWWENFQMFLFKYNLAALYIGELTPASEYHGFQIMQFQSLDLPEGDYHAVVGKDGGIVHNPREGRGITKADFGSYKGAFLFLTLNPEEQVRRINNG